MARLRDCGRYSAHPGKLTGRVFGEDHPLRSSRQESGQPRYDLRPTRETAVLSLDRMTTRPERTAVLFTRLKIDLKKMGLSGVRHDGGRLMCAYCTAWSR